MPDFDDPFKPPDATVMRPRPGAGRRSSPDSAPPPAAARPLAPHSQAPRVEPLPESSLEFLGIGLNPLVRAASPLLLLAGQLRGTLSPPDVGGLRRHARDEMRRFEQRARGGSISAEVVGAARYVLCATMDESVLSTPWGAQSEWAQHPLLVELHREAWGGEKFFEMLTKIWDDPERHIDLMELQYLCMALGFAGKYHALPQGHAQLADVQQTLFRKIRDYRGTPQPDLALKWRGVEDRRNPLIRYVPWWVVGAAVLAVLAVTFVVYYASLARAAAPVDLALGNLGQSGFDQPPPVALTGPTIKQLLAPQEGNRSLSVAEQGPLSTITLSADLFASGSAAVNPGNEQTLAAIAAAFTRVPGRMMVVGHTDSQQIQSLRFRDNLDLSRARAQTVATLIQKAMGNSAGIEWKGMGSEKPVVEERTAADRARNRRVEILHLRES
jgi:type VI secretion system protein ImpK